MQVKLQLTRSLFLFGIMFTFSWAFSQNTCCCCLKRELGQKAFDADNYHTAITKWQEAKKCSDATSSCANLDKLITAAKKKIEEQNAIVGQVQQCEEELSRVLEEVEALKAKNEALFKNQAIVEKQIKEQAIVEKQTKEQAVFEKQLRELDYKIWEIVEDANTKVTYQAYIDKFPRGNYVEQAEKKIQETLTSFSYEPEMVNISGGNFQMGSENGDINEKPIREVFVYTFFLSKYEITNAHFCAFLNEKGNLMEGGVTWIKIGASDSSGDTCRIYPQGTGFRVQKGYENHPVIFVSWYGAAAYCEWLSGKTGKKFRLPSESEWEYAAGNGIKHTTYSWGYAKPIDKQGGNICDETHVVTLGKYINKKEAYFRRDYFPGKYLSPKEIGKYSDGYIYAAPVGSFNANDFGLFDMSGNVWEWCQGNQNASAAIRGGSWKFEDGEEEFESGRVKNERGKETSELWYDYYAKDYYAVTRRKLLSMSEKASNIGFRVARD